MRRSRKREGAQAEALAAWRGAVLRAAEEVETALARLSEAHVERAALEAQVAALATARRQAQQAYQGGVIGLIYVTDADRELLAASDRLAAVRGDEARAAVSAYRALGGGWHADVAPALAAAAGGAHVGAMRYASEHKAETRVRVLKEAAMAIRRDGVDRVGVAQIMGAAGLTHGGFYAHFASKDDLVAQAVVYMSEDRYAEFFERLAEAEPRAALIRFVDRYVTMRHCAARDAGCPIPVLAGQVPNLPEAARERFVLATERLTEAVASLMRRMGRDDVDTVAAEVIAEMVGAVALARVQADSGKAEALLAAVRESVKAKLKVG